LASGSWTQSKPAITAAESSKAAPHLLDRPARSAAKVYRKPFSLAGRIIARVIICQLVLTAALTTVAVIYARREVARGFDTALNGWAINTLAAVRYTETQIPDLLFDPALLPVPSSQTHPDLFEIRRSDGSLLARSQTALPGDFKADGEFTDFVLNRVPYRAIILRNAPVLDREESVTVPMRVNVVFAAPVLRMRDQLLDLAISVGGIGLTLLLIVSVVAAWGVRRGLEPLRELATQAGAISVLNWEFQPPAEGSLAKELAPLTGAIETVLERLQESFRQQRDFTSDAAHELKTSVAIVKSTLQSLLQRPRPENEYRAGLEGLLEDCGRLEDLLGRLLRLTRIEQGAENGIKRKLGLTEITSTCEAAVSRIQALAEARNIEIQLAAPEEIHLQGDPEDLELIWVNLLENAVQYSPEGSRVVIRVESDGGGMACVSVHDSGPGIPEEHLPHVFQRFYRGDPSRSRSTGGFGLGLAICKAIVMVYGGQIGAISRQGQGTEIRVQLPIRPPDATSYAVRVKPNFTSS
jgi:signal transduction histidine kinase